jgi:hypothetical protein
MHDRQVELELAAEPSSPQIARDALAQLVPLPPDLLDRAQLITSELVTNGVRHGNDEAGGCIRFSAELHPTFLRIEVTNPATASRPTMQPRGVFAGFGRRLVAGYSRLEPAGLSRCARRWKSDLNGRWLHRSDGSSGQVGLVTWSSAARASPRTRSVCSALASPAKRYGRWHPVPRGSRYRRRGVRSQQRPETG